MTPIYASSRANLANWYAYNYPTTGRRIFWDGGVGKRESGATGFWCPYTGNIVDAPDKLVEAMPAVCIDGVIVGDEVIVTGLPRVQDFIGLVVAAFSDQTKYLFDDPTKQANFADEILRGNELLGDGPCRMVGVEQLPDDQYAALDYFREKYPDGIARHPLSTWTPYRSAWMAANVLVNRFDFARVREIHFIESLNTIDFVTVWATIEKEMKVIPMYPGDDQPECPFWSIKAPITLFTLEDQVIGYE